MNRLADSVDQLFDGLHHPVVVLIGDVQLQHRELRVVRSVHALVPEVSGELENAIKPADNKPLEVQLIGNPQVQRDVKGIVVGRERACRRTTGNGL